ncbi:uncharacterized membrane protein HdeD (DUF308 family) [Rhizobium tibeticum]|uniref:DUF308 domain-containing protein n=1 Tax=Rhizobium tibeticum TaxID=501024 RepID=UPI002786DEDB|nr:DUF308 domain-containing protein [Rhizobium tibeticum]MDP9810735.1 uncharacterized membrane protein HdeD (DUF308 family) [Rhizobium tibeticum]
MTNQKSAQSNWLRSYYYVRAAFSIVWVAVAILSASNPILTSVLLVIYPAWDAVANVVDAGSNGGFKANSSQTLNIFVSTVTTAAVILAAAKSTFAVLAVFGVWAILSGVLQLMTGVSRWRDHGAQWAMILSGGQSCLAGGFMITQSLGGTPPSILDITPYAGFGAFYFLISAIWLAVSARRKATAAV